MATTKNRAAQSLVNLRWKGRLSHSETRKLTSRLMSRLHTKTAVATYLGVSRLTVSNWLSGKLRAPASIVAKCDKLTELEVSGNTA